MVKTIDPANCACSNYVKKDGKVYKVMNEEEVTVSAMDSNNNEEEYLDRGAAQNNTMPEDCMMQLDGLNDEDSDGDMYDSDTDVVRPNIFTSQYYLDNLSETSSLLLPLPLNQMSQPHRIIWMHYRILNSPLLLVSQIMMLIVKMTQRRIMIQLWLQKS